MIETNRLIIKPLAEEDRDFYIVLAKETLVLKALFEMAPDESPEIYWNILHEDFQDSFSIFLKENGKLIGKVSIEKNDEIGIQIIREYQNIGIGTESIIGFVNWLYNEKGKNKVTVCTDPQNMHSQYMFEKLGAIFIGQKYKLVEASQDYIKEREVEAYFKSLSPLVYRLNLPILL